MTKMMTKKTLTARLGDLITDDDVTLEQTGYRHWVPDSRACATIAAEGAEFLVSLALGEEDLSEATEEPEAEARAEPSTWVITASDWGDHPELLAEAHEAEARSDVIQMEIWSDEDFRLATLLKEARLLGQVLEEVRDVYGAGTYAEDMASVEYVARRALDEAVEAWIDQQCLNGRRY